MRTEFEERPVSLTDWVITLLLTSIPLVGIIMLFIWAFGDSTPVSIQNWAKATHIWMLMGGIIATFLILVLWESELL